MTEIDCPCRIGSGPTIRGFKLGCMNFAEAFGNTPNSRSNRARNNSNLPTGKFSVHMFLALTNDTAAHHSALQLLSMPLKEDDQ